MLFKTLARVSYTLVTLACSAGIAQGATITASDGTFGAFDNTSGTRSLVLASGGTVTDVNIFIDFGKCNDPAMQPGQNTCPVGGEEFASETFFFLTSPLGTRVDLVYTYTSVPEGVAQGSTKANGTYDNGLNVGGRFQVLYDDQALLAAGPVFANGSFRPEELLSLFNGEDALGTWILTVGDSVAADPLSYFSSRLEVTVDAAAVPEPATLTLLASGLLVAAFSARRRRASVTK